MSAAEELSPVYIPISQVARVLDWSYLRTYRWLKREGAIIRIGNRLFTTRARLRASFPEVLSHIDGF